MSDAPKPKDLLITYACGASEKGSVHHEVLKALQDGYRVVDVIHTPIMAGGGSAVIVTVLLILPEGPEEAGIVSWYKSQVVAKG